MLLSCMGEWRVITICAGSTLGKFVIIFIGVWVAFGLTKKFFFLASFFYKHPLLLKYEWYWRLEPEIKYFCDIT